MHLQPIARRTLPDTAPSHYGGIMRWSNGDSWMPEPNPTQPIQAHRASYPRRLARRHTQTASAQVLGLARLAGDNTQE
jgi:hypothetical protein